MNIKLIKFTPVGQVALIWSLCSGSPRIFRVLLLASQGRSAGEKTAQLYPHLRPASCAEIEFVCKGICALLEGEDIVFSLDSLDISRCPVFQQAVLRLDHRISRGRVSTYKLIAASLGNLNAARAVGRALAENPFPLIVPCHRVIRSDRYPGGFQGGLKMKRRLLEKEGIVFDRQGRAARVFCENQESNRIN